MQDLIGMGMDEPTHLPPQYDRSKNHNQACQLDYDSDVVEYLRIEREELVD